LKERKKEEDIHAKDTMPSITLQEILSFLKCASDPGFQLGVAEDVGISQPTVSRIFHKVMVKIVEKSALWIPMEKAVCHGFQNSYQDAFCNRSSGLYSC
jgi:hypothetical protein